MQKNNNKEEMQNTISEQEKKNEVLWHDRKHIMWFPIGLTAYTVKNNRLYMDRGLLTTVSDQTLLYRITDLQLCRTLGQKIFGTGTIKLFCKVDVEREILLENVKRPKEVLNLLSELIESSRQKTNVVGKEFYGSGYGAPHGGPHDGPEGNPDDFIDDLDDLPDDDFQM